MPNDVATLLEPVCASRAWIEAVAAGWPYASLAELTARSDAVLAELSWTDVEEALAAHPRIGERAAGAGREAAWSRREQSAAANRSDATAAALHEANVEYEQRFGQVFLICATGRSADQILAEARRRLNNDVETERAEVRHELAAIVRLRLAKLLSPELP